MRILTLDNTTYDLDHLPEEVDDMRFAILDNSNPAEPDYHFIPLIFLESFNAPALVLRIGDGIAAGGDEDVAAIDLASVSGGDRHELQHRGDHRTNR